MSRTHGAGTYRILLADNRLRRTFALAMLGRLGYAVLPLSFMFTAAETSGSFRTGAAAIGIFGFAGLLMPFQARLMDARSQRAVLPAFGSMFLAAMTVALVMAATHVDSPIAWFAVALFGGASAPSLGPAMRAQWRAATTEADLPTAYSLDSVAEESAFLAGPVIAAGMLALGPAWHGALLAAMLIPVGVIGLALSPWASIRREAEDGPRRGILGPLRRGRFRVLLVVMAVGGFAGSLHLTSVAGLADLSGMPAVTGLVEAGCGVLAVLGGLWWGSSPAPPPGPSTSRPSH
ncbi:hypothetical protein [Nocardioides alcanivorans]|uniref:hypothetical protein n=1 Tax=Nocardioides alcanivorans TaxID=2897352 RepID=UPI001F344100|nr:hypothetical protein [Nocardioides alcanivorans]